MRLTAELVEKSASFVNALRERELDLRSNRIPMIENLAVTRDDYDCIDLTDNDLTRLDGLPILPRLRCLLLSSNRITRIQSDIGKRLPGLQILVLQSNRISKVEDLEPLGQLKYLKHLSLLDNPVTRTMEYRLKAIGILPMSVKSLDYRRITRAERIEAQSMIRNAKRSYSELNTEGGDDVRTEDDIDSERFGKISRLTDDEKRRIEHAIQSASTIDEISRLERMLATGHVPDKND